MATAAMDAILVDRNSQTAVSSDALLKSFEGDIRPIRTTATYRLGILAVTVVMVLLPVLYVALIALVGFAVYWHAVHNIRMLEYGGSGRGKLMVLLAYLAPMIVGSIMTLFMMKPLFARAAKGPRKRSLSRSEEPLLFAFVDRICQAVHAPPPKRIDIDSQINASAGFRRGFLSMLLGNDLVLTIGMPLVVGLSLRQFAGVLAHEFGHFSQGAGMRLTYVIRSISFWFTRVVYERDAWDETLDQWANEVDIRFGWILHLARFFVWLSRRCLWVLMVVGHVVASYMLRQMEYDADLHECRLAGSDVFASTARRLMELNFGNSAAQHDLQNFYRDGRLGDDLSRLIAVNVEQFPAKLQSEITKLIDESTTGKLDTHPSNKDRIASARRENAPGIFHAEGPASVLFRDVGAASRAVTMDYYEQLFGEGFRREQVFPLDELLARQNFERESARAMERFFQGTFNLVRPLPIPMQSLLPPDQPQAAVDMLRKNREIMVSATPVFQNALKKFDEADTQLLQAHCARSVFSAHEFPRAQQYSFAVGSSGAVDMALQKANESSQSVEAELAQFEIAAKARLTLALALLFDPEVAQKIENATAIQSEAQRLLPTLQQLNQLFPTTIALRNTRTALGILFSHVKPAENTAALVGQIKKEATQLRTQLLELRRQVQSLNYPFDHAEGPMSVADFLLKKVPEQDDFGALFDAGSLALEQITSLLARLLGRLAHIAEIVESSLGLPPLAAPIEDPTAKEAS